MMTMTYLSGAGGGAAYGWRDSPEYAAGFMKAVVQGEPAVPKSVEEKDGQAKSQLCCFPGITVLGTRW